MASESDATTQFRELQKSYMEASSKLKQARGTHASTRRAWAGCTTRAADAAARRRR
jgi:hypothetical protein